MSYENFITKLFNVNPSDLGGAEAQDLKQLNHQNVKALTTRTLEHLPQLLTESLKLQ